MSIVKLNLFNQATCKRCGTKCVVDPIPGSKAKMLKRADHKDGLCIACAVHDTLRHLYPANLILARSGPKGFMLPEMQRMFYDLVRLAGTDAAFEEINWGAMMRNWDLPFPTPVKSFAQNPVTQKDLDIEEAYAVHQRRPDCNIWTDEQRESKRKEKLDSAIAELIRGLPGVRNIKIRTDDSDPLSLKVFVEEITG